MSLEMFGSLGVEACCSDESGLVGNAKGVAFPRSTKEVQSAMAAAWTAGEHVTVQGARTGLCAGAVPDGGLILNLSRMMDILDFSYRPGEAAITVQSGMTLEKLKNALEKKHANTVRFGIQAASHWKAYAASGETLEFYPNPTEETATLGGVAATAAVGPHSLEPGTLVDYILSMELVKPDGTVVLVQKGMRAWDVLPDCTDGGRGALEALCGSEGAYGAVTALTLKLNVKPRLACGLLCYFHTYDALLDFFARMRETVSSCGEMVCAAAEWFSASCGQVLKQERNQAAATFLPEFPRGAAAALWMEFSGESEDSLFDLLGCALEFLEEAGQFPDQALAATDEVNLERLGAMRHVLIEIANCKSPCSQVPPYDWILGGGAGLACAVQVGKCMEREALPYLLMGHLLSGHCSLRILDGGRRHRAGAAVEGILKEFGCAFSQEHGCGRIKKRLREELDHQA